MDITDIKARFGIIGQDAELCHTIETAVAVAPIHLSVLIIGESGSGKEAFPQIIHAYSSRKHKTYVAVNCGAIPEGTIDSELFGHEKGAFTGALAERRGYFEEADGGTIFLDEIGELPLATQAKLLRVLEKGEYMRVGSSVVKKTDVRIVAATNVDLEKAIGEGKFREDLFYRLNGIMLRIPPLRKRVADIPALFHKFTSDFADKNHIPPVRLTEGAQDVLQSFDWPGNVRQLKNVAEQVTVLAKERTVSADEMLRFLPEKKSSNGLLPQVGGSAHESYNSDRDLLYKVLFDMRRDMTDLKKLVLGMIRNGGNIGQEDLGVIERLYDTKNSEASDIASMNKMPADEDIMSVEVGHLRGGDFRRQIANAEQVSPVRSEAETEAKEAKIVDEQTYSLADGEREMICKALERNGGSRRKAARELQISERTLYRKIHDYGLEDM